MSDTNTAAKKTAEKPLSRSRTTGRFKAQNQRRRRSEIDGSMRGKLTLDTRCLDMTAWHYRWVSADPERVNLMTTQDDYDLVEHEDIHATTGDDSFVRRRGGEHGMVLARKPREFFEQDQSARAQVLDQTDQQIRKGGRAAADLGDKGYIPAEGMRFVGDR